MPISDQGMPKEQRYQFVPRVLVFLTCGDEVLLLKGAPTKRVWPNQYNGLGGHIERGESVLEAAQRVPDQMILETSLLGSEAMVRERIRAYRDAGVTMLRLDPMGDSLSERLDTLGRALDLVRSESP